MRWMFADAEAFNQPLNKWDVSNVMNMRSMFENANSFKPWKRCPSWAPWSLPGTTPAPCDGTCDYAAAGYHIRRHSEREGAWL